MAGGQTARAAGAERTAPPRRRTTPGRRALLVVASLLAALGVLEVGLRVAGDRERAFAEGRQRVGRRWTSLVEQGLFESIADPVRRYAMRPGAVAEVDGWTFRVTRHRSRGEDFPLEKPPDERRLLCLGDSFAFGLWCDASESLVGHLARLANEAEREAGTGITWRAIDLGVPGYHSGQQLRALEQDGLALEPDVVLLYFNTNDIVSEGFFLDEEHAGLRSDHLPFPVWLRRALWSSHLYGFVLRRIERSWLTRPSPHLDPSVPWAHVREDNQEATRAAIAEIARLCRGRGVPLFAVNQPLMTWSGDTRNPDWRVLPLVRWAERTFAELGIPRFDTLGWMRNYADGVDRFPAEPTEGFLIERYFADEAVQAYFAGRDAEMPAEPDFHLVGEGYGHLARLVYPRMREEGLLP